MKIEMVEVNTADLIGPALDWAVLFSVYGDGPDWRLIDGALFIVGLQDVRVGMDGIGQQETIDPFHPSTRWQDGGPLIDKYDLELIKFGGKWHAVKDWYYGEPISEWPEGDTFLIAACRASVAKSVGGAVSVPRALMP